MRAVCITLVGALVVGSLPVSAASPQGARPVSTLDVGQEIHLVGSGEELPEGPVIVTIRPRGSGRRVFVGVWESEVVLLNLTASGLTASLIRQLRRLAVDKTEALREAHTVIAGSLQLGPTGLVVEGRKIAELGDIVERIPLADIEGGGVRSIRRFGAGETTALIVLGILGGLLALMSQVDH